MLTSAGIGEAVVTVMTETGAPSPVAWTRMFAPRSLMGPAPEAVDAVVAASPLMPKYATVVDSYSAFEKLSGQAGPGAAAGAAGGEAGAAGASGAGAAGAGASGAAGADGSGAASSAQERKEAERAAREQAKEEERRRKEEERERQKRNDAMMRVGTNVASQIGRELVRGIFGTSRSRSRKGRGGFGGLFG